MRKCANSEISCHKEHFMDRKKKKRLMGLMNSVFDDFYIHGISLLNSVFDDLYINGIMSTSSITFLNYLLIKKLSSI